MKGNEDIQCSVEMVFLFFLTEVDNSEMFYFFCFSVVLCPTK